ncbi:MAG: hypothetical protein ABI629_18115 [bacterium]
MPLDGSRSPGVVAAAVFSSPLLTLPATLALALTISGDVSGARMAA